MNLDYLAYCILTLAAIFIVLPIVGNSINDRVGYWQSLATGGTLLLFISCFGIVLSAITWAIVHVLGA